MMLEKILEGRNKKTQDIDGKGLKILETFASALVEFKWTRMVEASIS